MTTKKKAAKKAPSKQVTKKAAKKAAKKVAVKVAKKATLTPKQKLILELARHEGGHYILCRVHRIPVSKVEISLDGLPLVEGGDLGGLVSIPAEHRVTSDRQELQMLLAGVAGQRVHHIRSGRLQVYELIGCAQYDWEKATAIVRTYGESAQANDRMYDQCFRDAWEIIKANAVAHGKIVDGLVAKGKLADEEAMELLNEEDIAGLERSYAEYVRKYGDPRRRR